MQRFRPMGLGDIFDEAFDLYRKNFLFLLLVAAVAVVPIHLLAPLLASRFAGEPSLSQSLTALFGTFVPSHTFSQLGPFFDGPAFSAPLYPLVTGIEVVALAGACSACYLKGTPTLWAAYRVPLRRIGALLVTLPLYLLSLTLGAALCFLPVLFPLTWFALTAHTFALEGQSFSRALGRSRRLVTGDGGRVFGCLVLLSALYTVVGTGIQLPLIYVFDLALNLSPHADPLFGSASSPVLSRQHFLIGQTCQGLSDLVLTPFVFSVLTVLYYDLRIRKEAFDVELMARGLGYPALSALTGYLPPAIFTPSPTGIRRTGSR